MLQQAGAAAPACFLSIVKYYKNLMCILYKLHLKYSCFIG